MSTFRTIKSDQNPYVILDKRFLSDSRISWRSKGILSYLLSKPDDWQTREADLIKQSTEGRDAVRAALRELEACGYMQKEQRRSGRGAFATNEYIIIEAPLTENPSTVKPSTVSPSPENPTHTNNDSTKNEVTKNENTTPRKKARDAFGEDYESFKILWNESKPRKSATLVDNKEVAKALCSEVKRLGAEEFLRRARAALAFIVTQPFHVDERPCPPITLLRHLDSYAEQAPQEMAAQTEKERPSVGSKVEHPNWGVNTVRYYAQDGYMVLDECGARALPDEVKQVPADTPIGYASWPS